ncbi:SMI1/KNR4 family protein [Streptococcus pseudopneumoniae]|uniref:SMI1/KNR4 family protein n=1 Tax=Streptococcus pseudopneumoniae TaxID=257758 RepID=UPI00066A8A9B|nr:SMI1/KNR4 family protein [Streptococcus pseudopneumoniae]
MQLIDKVKKIETYICEYFEDWDLDDPAKEEYLADYQKISGASEKELQAFEERLGIRLPSDFKALYSYKNGSKYFSILPCVIDQRDLPFSLMSLQKMESCKKYFQNRDALLTDFPDYFSSQDLENMRDSRIKPYLFNKKWIPFAQYCDSCYLMLDFDPDREGQEGQIICYIHDPDEIIYVAESLTELIEGIVDEII